MKKLSHLKTPFLLLALCLITGLIGCGGGGGGDDDTPPPPVTEGLTTVDLIVGNGRTAQNGNTLRVSYVGRLTDGTVFDNSSDSGQLFQFVLGTGRVIRGWDLGLVGMREGGRRQLIISPELGYGQFGSPPRIPGNATLIFEVELVQVQ